jgi:hypothetical protein
VDDAVALRVTDEVEDAVELFEGQPLILSSYVGDPPPGFRDPFWPGDFTWVWTWRNSGWGR